MGFFGAPFKSKGAETAAGTGTRRAFRRSIFLRSRGGERRLRALENGGVLFLNETGRQLELAANAAEHRQIRGDEHFFLLRPNAARVKQRQPPRDARGVRARRLEAEARPMRLPQLFRFLRERFGERKPGFRRSREIALADARLKNAAPHGRRVLLRRNGSGDRRGSAFRGAARERIPQQHAENDDGDDQRGDAEKFRRSRDVRETLPLGVLYAGTSPDFCSFHHIPLDPFAALETLRSGGVEPVEVLKITHNGKTAHFLCSCNLGIGADVAARANVLRPYLGNRFGTFCVLLVSLLKHPRFDYTVNGESFPACGHMLITKMPYIAGGLALDLPRTAEGEYLLWHTRARSFPGWMRLLVKLYRKEECGELRRCSGTIRIKSRTPCRVEYDGDPHGTLPVEISVAPRKLMLIKGGGQP